MKEDIRLLRAGIVQLEAELRRNNQHLDRAIRDCHHNWGVPEYTPDIQKAYTLPGDEPGTMGVDWRGPCHVPEKVTRKWTRTCLECGHSETTKSTKSVPATGLGVPMVMGTKPVMVEVPAWKEDLR